MLNLHAYSSRKLMKFSENIKDLTSCIPALLAFWQNERRKIKNHSLLSSVTPYQLYTCAICFIKHAPLFIFFSVHICSSIRQNENFFFRSDWRQTEDSGIQEVNMRKSVAIVNDVAPFNFKQNPMNLVPKCSF